MGEQNCAIIIIGGVLGIGALLTVILVPMSFGGLEYYEFGFKRQKSTGTVDTDKAYDGGKYMIGPDYEFKVFPADAHTLQLYDVSVYTLNGLPIVIDVYFQYFLRQEDLPILHKKYDINYESVMRKNGVAALKAECPKHPTWSFITDRKNVEAALFKAIRERLGGTCCAKDCSTWEFACSKDCIPVSRCDPAKDKGYWVDVKYLQLGLVTINSLMMERFMDNVIQHEANDRLKLVQEAQVIRKRTDAEVREIKNKAVEIRQEANAVASLLKTKSQANYTLIVESARAKGLKDLYSALKITDQETKNSFDYLRTLRGLDNIHLTVDFQQKIVGGLG